MVRRYELDAIFAEIVGDADRVYFQPPHDTQMEYPCIVYQRDSADTKHADNAPYKRTQRYQVTVIDRDPDSLLPAQVAALPMCTFSRFMRADRLNHDIFTLYF